ncbi:MAG: class C sortase [Oscillospiraceae bacterium]|nr:class C sortase [Oscillospiraceae bacterium]
MKKAGKKTTALLFILLIVGLFLLLYPSVSEYWNRRVQSRAIVGYLQEVSTLDDNKYAQFWEEARAFNQKLLERRNEYELPESLEDEYHSVLNVANNGIMGYIDIPVIGTNLPIYHGTEEKVLQVAIGHLDWSSLPTGGENTHCVVSGHRGLPSARLFSDLDKLVLGDLFTMHVLDERLTYEVDQILIVEPHEVSDLVVEEGKDLVTLVTCTPYGVNSHRLLVRGHRVETQVGVQHVRVTADAVVIEKLVVVPFVLVPILMMLMVFLLISIGRKKNRRKKR